MYQIIIPDEQVVRQKLFHSDIKITVINLSCYNYILITADVIV